MGGHHLAVEHDDHVQGQRHNVGVPVILGLVHPQKFLFGVNLKGENLPGLVRAQSLLGHGLHLGQTHQDLIGHLGGLVVEGTIVHVIGVGSQGVKDQGAIGLLVGHLLLDFSEVVLRPSHPLVREGRGQGLGNGLSHLLRGGGDQNHRLLGGFIGGISAHGAEEADQVGQEHHHGQNSHNEQSGAHKHLIFKVVFQLEAENGTKLSHDLFSLHTWSPAYSTKMSLRDGS